jgi:hypothetical protein
VIGRDDDERIELLRVDRLGDAVADRRETLRRALRILRARGERNQEEGERRKGDGGSMQFAHGPFPPWGSR